MPPRVEYKAYVLDAWAIMAYLEDEPAGKTVETVIIEAQESELPLMMSVANVAEVWYTFAHEANVEEADQALAGLKQLGITFLDVTLELALQAVRFKAQHRLSLADSFAAALAVQHKAELVTGDPEFATLKDSVKIIWLAQRSTGR